MTSADSIAARTRGAMLTNLRQQLVAPVSALVEYSELLCEAAEQSGCKELGPDLQRILTAAKGLSQIVNGLVEENVSHGIFGSNDLKQAERTLRHDIRTPINAIKGYGEMLLEDLENSTTDGIRVDLDKLLTEASRLLSDLDTIVKFSLPGEANADQLLGETETTISELIESIEQVDESTLKEEIGRILVVDDIEANRDLLSRRLAKQRHRVEVAPDGREALLLLEQKKFDLVLLDLMMPGMNGFEVLKRMKSDPNMRNVPVIMVSALNETDSVVRCIEAGAHDYLLKPIDPVMLRARISSGLESKQWSDDERQQRQYIRQAFSRFVSPAVVDQLINDPEKLTLGGERLDITCVFTDLADFTHLIERSKPTEVMPVLNRYLDGLCRIFLNHDGTIDKIVGDALHGFFGAPLRQTDHAQRAMQCVLDLNEYARRFVTEPDATALGFGVTRIGVHSGAAVVGNFGGEAFFDYTAHGDVINTTARMESANKHLGTTICVSADTARKCAGISFRPIGKLLLKGKTQPVDVFEPITGELVDSRQLADYLDAFRFLENGGEDPRVDFSELAKLYPGDALIALHARRLAAGESGPLIVMGEK